MIAYKLVKLRKNGTLGSLFIGAKNILEIGKWLDAEFIPKNGFAPRFGWHCTLKPIAPHLSIKGRIWVQVEITDLEYYSRPECQGGTWVLAKKMKIIKILEDNEYE